MMYFAVRTKHTTAFISNNLRTSLKVLENKGPCFIDGRYQSFKDSGYSCDKITEEEAFSIINQNVEQHDFGHSIECRMVGNDIRTLKETGSIAFGGFKEKPEYDSGISSAKSASG